MSYRWLPLKMVLHSLPAMDAKGVSKVARGKEASTQTKEGFVEAYIATNGSIDKMNKRLTGRNNRETWGDRRKQFVARHLEQMRNSDTYSDGWLPNGDPTPRHLGLIAWAYSPSPKRLSKWLKTQPREWKQFVSNPNGQLNLDFRENDHFIPTIPKDVMLEIVHAITDAEAKQPTVVIGTDTAPKNKNVKEAIDLGYIKVVAKTPHTLSGMTMYAIKPTRKGYALNRKRREIIQSQQEQLALFANPSKNWIDENADFVSTSDISLLIPPHDIEDPKKVTSIKKSLLKHGWNGRPFLSMGDDLLTGTHRHGAIVSILNDYEDSDDSILIERIEDLGLSGHDKSIPIIDISEYLQNEDIEELEYRPDEEQKIKYLSSIKYFPKEIVSIYQKELAHQNNPSKSIIVPIHMISKAGIHEKIGEIKLSDSSKGLRIDTDLYNLPMGFHGTHIHEYGSLLPKRKGSKVIAGGQAGSHYDPDGAGFHGSPNGDGHRGDLPKIHVDEYGESKQTLYAPRLKLDEIKGRSIIIHRYGDNYSDSPLPNGGGKERMAGGIITESCPHCRKNPVVRDGKGRKVPSKYYDGYTGKDREKRIKEIERRRDEYEKAYKRYGDEKNFPQELLDRIYRPFVTDKEEETKESEYTKEARDRGFFGTWKEKARIASKYYGGRIDPKILHDVYRRGVGAWPTGHRGGATKEQWGNGRVNSFLVGGATFLSSDKDLAQKLPEKVYKEIMKQKIEV